MLTDTERGLAGDVCIDPASPPAERLATHCRRQGAAAGKEIGRRLATLEASAEAIPA